MAYDKEPFDRHLKDVAQEVRDRVLAKQNAVAEELFTIINNETPRGNAMFQTVMAQHRQVMQELNQLFTQPELKPSVAKKLKQLMTTEPHPSIAKSHFALFTEKKASEVIKEKEETLKSKNKQKNQIDTEQKMKPK